MAESIKKIYASLQIGDGKIKLLVGEFFNTRFNVIKSSIANTNALNGFEIADKDQLIADIKKLVMETSSKIGAKIEKVILVLPSYNFKRFPLRSSVVPSNGIVKKEDIARAITNSLKTNVDYDVLVTNTVINKYTINGLSTRRLPEKEVCQELIVDLDLLCCDKTIAINYVDVVESSGLKVLDICLNSYAVCKDASLIEESLKKNVILLDINNTETYLTLLSKGKQISTEIIYEGLNNLVNKVKSVHNIPINDIERLIKYGIDYDSVNDEDIIYAYTTAGKNFPISVKELSNLVLPELNHLVETLLAMCKPILDQGDTMLVVTGEGQQMSALINKLSAQSAIDVVSYYPETIGVRDSSLSALFGSFIVYKEKAYLNNLTVTCLDLLEYESVIDHKKVDVEGESLTSKIKNLFIQYIN